MDIASWLRQMGLEQYESVFRAHAIEGSVLPSLTAEDLKDLGVELVGHRRKLLDAIAALHTAPTPVSGQQATMPAGAERRHLTILFCDLVGSTPLSTRFDPEDLREIIGAYHRQVADCIAAFDGFVAKYMGDGVLAYFGYPQAHEDDAERAVRSALTLTTAVAQVASPLPLRVRIGIASGLAVVGDLVGTGEAQERGIVGETPNLAARLQALAEPNAIIVADGTRREIGALFEVCDLGRQTLAGFAEPQRAWRIIGEDRELSRFEALRSGATPLVGRDEEIALLRRSWARTRDGEGHAVLIGGEAGVGKSRLSAAFFEHIREEPHLRLRHFCSPYHQDSALHPIIVRLERAAGFAPDDPPERRLDRLEALLALTAPSTEELALFAELLSLPGAARYRPLDMTPQRKKENTFEAWLRQLECFARQQPIILLFEDLHWLDPSSGELLDLLIEKIEGWPVLLIATFRPDFQPRWTGEPQVTTLSLTRLNRQHSAELVARVADLAGALPSDLAAEIVERCDGVPLFLEELTKATIEQAAAPERARSLVGAVPGPGAVPATLQASLMARLDRLGAAARELAQVGARSAANLRSSCSSRSIRAIATRWRTHSRALSRRGWCFNAVRCRKLPSSSSTSWCKMLPMAVCCASGVGSCTAASPTRCSRLNRPARLRSWLIICRMPATHRAPSAIGVRLASGRCCARPTAKLSSISTAPWRCSKANQNRPSAGAMSWRSCLSSSQP